MTEAEIVAAMEEVVTEMALELGMTKPELEVILAEELRGAT